MVLNFLFRLLQERKDLRKLQNNNNHLLSVKWVREDKLALNFRLLLMDSRVSE